MNVDFSDFIHVAIYYDCAYKTLNRSSRIELPSQNQNVLILWEGEYCTVLCARENKSTKLISKLSNSPFVVILFQLTC